MKLSVLWGFIRATMSSGSGSLSGFRNVLENAEREVSHLSNLIPAGKYAVERLETAPPGRGVNVMIGEMPLRQKMRVLPVMLGTVDAAATCGHYMSHTLTPTRSAADETVWNNIRELAMQQGAVEVGFARINEHDIFKEFAIPYRNAIVFTIHMKKEAIDTAPSYDALIEVMRTYGSLGRLAVKVSDHLRKLGYGAYPGSPMGGIVDYVRVAQDAGIGAIGYHGMLISPSDGTRQRINVVFTNMEIPEPQPNPHQWILDFCAMCRRCVRSCPPQAIYTSAQPDPVTGRKKTVHFDKCVTYFGENQGCAVCVKVCPFSQAGYDKVKEGFLTAETRRKARTQETEQRVSV